jgi:GNAT superfamily N-acetyltransferase
MVELKEIGESNYKEVLALDVDPDQKSHVAPNVVSLAQAWVFRDVARPFAIFADDTVVGFAMLEVDLKKPSYDIWRFMIDRHHQRKGYGVPRWSAFSAYCLRSGPGRSGFPMCRATPLPKPSTRDADSSRPARWRAARS